MNELCNGVYFIILWLIISILIVTIITICLDKKCEKTENFEQKENSQPSKEELRNQATALFKKLDDENTRHNQEMENIKTGFEKILSLSLDPSVQLVETPAPKKVEECKFLIDLQLNKIKELYNNYKNNKHFELVHVYERPIMGQARDKKNKYKTYGYVYIDNTMNTVDNPYYQFITKVEKYGNMTLLFDDNCKVIELISIEENPFK